MTDNTYFSVAAMQPNMHYAANLEELWDKNLNRWLELIDHMVPYWSMITGAPCRLLVFPEYGFMSLPRTPDGSWNGVSIKIPGPETDALAEKARKHGVYIGAHAWVEYDDLPGRPMSVAFLIAPDGSIPLIHHKVVTSKSYEAGSAAPGDVYDWFVKKFGDGLDAFFPVAQTELGGIGFQICGEGQYAETSRGLMLNGAEILLRPNAWIEPWMAEPQDLMSVITRFHAFSNMTYVVEANRGHLYHPGRAVDFGAGRSMIADYTGRLLARASAHGEMGVAAEVNMESLRRYREESGFCSRTVFMPTEIFAKVYTDSGRMWPSNTLMGRETSMSSEEWEEIRRQVIESRRDVFKESAYRRSLRA
ncbi:hypothetical protein DPM19_01115 [Actinomadura craniellae]|uniref:CN hydrolase domain-containing protein n=1 Tax=Actinomadura craniellae TaxID=2231787 RepID=A0A365HCN5_9ACTN|nr:nitrilase-related carbon-nitrogen hydrolase [Actinomadura craniellae]RAY16799.1 hypothetical protein DPM19_01115 [Actinomadura craniellae]